MSVEDDDDRAAFVDPDEFGTAVTWTLAGIPQPAFNALFSRPSATAWDDGDGVGLVDRAATLICREADLPAGAAEEDPVAVAVAGEATAYVCRTIKPDGTGMATVTLQRAS